jgi:hypothetical protein
LGYKDGLIGAIKGNRVAGVNLPVWMIGIFKTFTPEQTRRMVLKMFSRNAALDPLSFRV